MEFYNGGIFVSVFVYKLELNKLFNFVSLIIQNVQVVRCLKYWVIVILDSRCQDNLTAVKIRNNNNICSVNVASIHSNCVSLICVLAFYIP